MPRIYTFGKEWSSINDFGINNLNVKSKTLQIPEGIKFLIDYDQWILDMTPKALIIKSKLNKWKVINLEGFCTRNETINKIKRQLKKWKNNQCFLCQKVFSISCIWFFFQYLVFNTGLYTWLASPLLLEQYHQSFFILACFSNKFPHFSFFYIY